MDGDLRATELADPLDRGEAEGEMCIRDRIHSIPGVVQHTLDSVVVESKRLASLGVPALILFGVPLMKDAVGSVSYTHLPGESLPSCCTTRRSA